jgi:hypothetical protein
MGEIAIIGRVLGGVKRPIPVAPATIQLALGTAWIAGPNDGARISTAISRKRPDLLRVGGEISDLPIKDFWKLIAPRRSPPELSSPVTD